MVISKENKITTETLYETIVFMKQTRKLCIQFPQKNWTKGCLDSLITC